MVEIKGAGGKGPDRGSLNLLQGEVEEGPVVGLEFHLPVGGEDLIVTSQIFQGGEAASGMACLGPGIREVQIDPVHFTRGENLGDVRRTMQINRRLEGTASPAACMEASFSTGRRRTLEYRSIPI